MSNFGSNNCLNGFEPLTECDLIPIETEISFPNRSVLDLVGKDDFLKVALRLSGNSTSVILMFKGQVAGEITSPVVQKLPEYIVRGTDYMASLIRKDEEHFVVLIRAIE